MFTDEMLDNYMTMTKDEYVEILRGLDTEGDLFDLLVCWDWRYEDADRCGNKELCEQYARLSIWTADEYYSRPDCDADFDADIGQELVDAYCWWDD